MTSWLERTRLPFPPGPCPDPLAVQAWNMMGGMDWAALPLVADLLGVADPERLVQSLLIIRDDQRGHA